MGPVCIHKTKDTQSYYNFLSTLIAKNNELREMKAIGTDGETTPSNAVLLAFENAVHLRCFNHVNTNVKNKLKDIGVSKTDKNRILTDIFGSTGDISLKMIDLTDFYACRIRPKAGKMLYKDSRHGLKEISLTQLNIT